MNVLRRMEREGGGEEERKNKKKEKKEEMKGDNIVQGGPKVHRRY